ncbi:MAG: hypothetical protein ACM3N0_08945 [Chloroflexota bacterium]
MTEGRAVSAVIEGRLDERLVERALEAAAFAPEGERIRDAVETVVDVAELDPDGTRRALWGLRGDPVALERLEACLAMSPERATLALGAAIQICSAELASLEPDLRERVPELLRWLEGTW